MSNDTNPGPPVVPGFPDESYTLASWGAAPLPPAIDAERPWVSPGRAQWVDNPGNRPGNYQPCRRAPRNWTVLLVLGSLIVAVLAIAGFIVHQLNVLPAAVPLVGMDSGVAVCKAISEGEKPTGSKDGGPITAEQYREIRQVFADSRYPAIRDNGVKLIDTGWQIQAIPEGEEMSALVYVGAFTSAYAGLSGGCAEQGYAIPPLSAS